MDEEPEYEDYRLELEWKAKAQLQLESQEETQDRIKGELRELQLIAYTSVLKAVRASGSLSDKRSKFVGSVKDFFEITEERHKAECRRVAGDPHLCLIAQTVQGDDGIELWKAESKGIVPTLPSFQRRGKKDVPDVKVEPGTVWEGKVPWRNYTIKSVTDCEEYGAASNSWKMKLSKESKYVQTIKSGLKREDESSDEKVKHERSPDITEPPRTTPVKIKSLRESLTRKGRGAKRRISGPGRKPAEREPPAKLLKTTANTTPTKIKIKRKQLRIVKVKPAKIKITPKVVPDPGVEDLDERPGSSSGDEGSIARKIGPMTDHLKMKAPSGRGRGLSRVRGRGTRGRGLGRGRPPIHHHGLVPLTSLARDGQSPENVTNQIPPTSPGKTLKVLKPKKPKPVSISRRKSRLKEKEDDEMQMEWDDQGYNDEHIIISNKRGAVKKRRRLTLEGMESDVRSSIEEWEGVIGPKSEIKENGERPEGYYSGHENPLHHRSNSPSAKQGSSSSRHSGGLSGEDTDSASEKGSISGYKNSNDSPTNNNNSSTSNSNINRSSPPPQTPMTSSSSSSSSMRRPKQRLKSPSLLTTNIQCNSSTGQSPLPRITLPPPVFSTSLSGPKKQRPPPHKQQHISVVDSLNLHLPTTATASSLAASSSSRRGSGSLSSGSGGCSMFSTAAQSLLANRASQVPVILQQQQLRKAQPHILANSKVLQRTFLPGSPPTNPSSNISGLPLPVNQPNLGSNTVIVSTAGTVMSPVVHQHHIQSGSVGSGGGGLGANIPSINSSSGTVTVQIPPNAGSGMVGPLSMGNAIPLGTGPVSRSSGPNIIFLQKPNNTPTVTVSTSSVTLPSNSLPGKGSSRAVILRRAQVPRPGNVMIVDMQKNALVNASPVPQYLQTRILSAPSELSVVNVGSGGGGQPNVKTVQAKSPEISEPSPIYNVPVASNQRRKKVLTIPQQQVFVNATPTSPTPSDPNYKHCQNIFSPDNAAQKGICKGISVLPTLQPKDSQLEEIEAQLMQMEQGVAYEEEVVTTAEDFDTSPQSCSTHHPLNRTLVNTSHPSSSSYPALSLEQPSHAQSFVKGGTTANVIVNISGSSTERGCEGDNSFTNTFVKSGELPRTKSIEVSITTQLDVRKMSDAVTRAIVCSNAVPVSSSISSDQVQLDPNNLNSSSSSASTFSVNNQSEDSLSNSATSSVANNFKVVEEEDIFQAALKSSGIVFTEQQFFSDEGS